MEESIWEIVKNSWYIKKKEIKELGINPNKQWNEMTIRELNIIAGKLDVTPYELLEYS